MNAASWQESVPTSWGRAAGWGLMVVLAFLGGFGLWAAWAPIAGAVVAMGVVQANGRNLVVDHLEGGVIASIPVGEGQWVRSGDTLLTLDTTRAAADRDRARLALLAAAARAVRARTEGGGGEALLFPPDLEAAAEASGIGEDLAQQRLEFESRLKRHRAEMAALDKRIAATRQEIAGLAAQKKAEERKLAVLREELRDKAGLLRKGLAPRGEVNALKRAEADALGMAAALAANIAERRATIAELEEQAAATSARRREQASVEANELAARITDLRQQLLRHEDVIARAVVKSPETGIVVRLSKNTVGSALKPGDVVAEILPTGSELLVETRLAPQDIDLVRVGQEARLRLVALDARLTPDATGVVSYVSADSHTDSTSQNPYYTARIRFAGLPQGVRAGQVQPGMPVEALIRTGERTFLGYLSRPFLDSFARAFREQ